MTTVGVYLSLGILLPSSVAAGYFIGRVLDNAFGTHFLYIVFLIMGIIGGFLQLMRQVMQDTRDDGN
ncbi:MAG: AtpZ/AtpI family protein [Acidobacteriia bacterium]|nr:AtpZ/AtpI family protein [Terriglobia bacterium]